MILLITHFMDEASFLADYIAILKKGKITIEGSNRYLIDNYGKYVSIKINKKLNFETAQKIVEYIKTNHYINSQKVKSKNKNKNNKDLLNDESKSSNEDQNTTALTFGSDYEKINNQVCLETYREKIIIRIPTNNFDFNNAYKLLEYLEKKDMKNYVIIKDQLEDVFINTIDKKINRNDKIDYMKLADLKEEAINYGYFGKLKNDFTISFFKRLKDYKTIIIEIIFPIMLTLIACLVSYVEWLEDNKSSFIDLNNFSNDTQTIFFEFSNLSHFEDYYSILYSDANEEKKKLKNYQFKYLRNMGGKENYSLSLNILGFMNTIFRYTENQNISNNTASFYLIAADKELHQYEFATFISTKKSHSPIAFTNYLLNNIIKFEIKKTNYKQYLDNVGIINSPFRLTYEERKNKKSRNGATLVFFISIGLSLIPSNFILTIIKEKENKSKHLQLLSGLSLLVYWINNYIFEIAKYFIISVFSLSIIKIFNFYEYYIISLYVLYGPALISFTYCLSYFLNKEGSGQTITLFVNLFFGTLGGSAVLILRTNKNLKQLGEFISYILRLVPTFCISYGYNELLSKKLLFGIDNYKENMNQDELETLKKKYNNSKYVIDYIKTDLIYLSIEIIVYTFFLIILENKDYLIWKLTFKKKRKNNGKYENDNDSDEEDDQTDKDNIQFGITTGKKKIKQKGQENKKDLILKVSNLTKIFNYFDLFKCKKKSFGINKLSFSVENGECFGLIGQNGAGKTTTFKSLCKEVRPDDGFVKINQIDIFDYSLRNKKPLIGYCPQFDSVFEHLTVEENLNFYGRLKGIREYNLHSVVNLIMKKLDLKKFENVKCKNLSGGNKRKLSVGISIICYPHVIFMDEPSTGMDPYTRRLLLDLLNKAYLKNQNRKDIKDNKDGDYRRAIILTTHSIEEVEALCDKIGILKDGSIEKDRKGAINDIVQNNSKGIELNVEFKKIKYDYIKENYQKNYKNLYQKCNNLNEIKVILGKEYNKYLVEDNILGKELIDLFNKKKNLKIYTILIWKEYLNFIFKLENKIKKYFKNCDITYMKYKLNNIILKIQNKDKKEKCDSFLFGIMEGFKEELNIEEYSYSLSTLESVFLDICADNNNKN